MLQSTNTLGATNAYPRVGPVVISEILYHPPDPYPGMNDSVNEYIELWNIASTNVPLYDPNAPTNTWRLRNAVAFDFPTNQTLSPGGHCVVVGFDPIGFPATRASFQAKYGLALDVPILGPWNGNLNNGGEKVELHRPDNPNVTPTNVYVPYYLVEQIAFDSVAPWPTAANGTGSSLQRIDLKQFGDDPLNWRAGAPFTGQPTLPAITRQPTGQTLLAGRTLTLGVTATGSEPLTYQWYFDVTNTLPLGTNAVLTIVSAQLSDSGSYQVVVANSLGAATSQVAVISVIAEPSITSQPADLAVSPGGQARFTVSATGTPPLSYQWFFNTNTPMPGTGSDLVLLNVQPSQSGYYQVVVANSYGTASSRMAHLAVITAPVIHPGDLQINATDVSVAVLSVAGVNYRLDTRTTWRTPPGLPFCQWPLGPVGPSSCTTQVNRSLAFIASIATDPGTQNYFRQKRTANQGRSASQATSFRGDRPIRSLRPWFTFGVISLTL